MKSGNDSLSNKMSIDKSHLLIKKEQLIFIYPNLIK